MPTQRRTIQVRRLSLWSLIKIFYLGSLGAFVILMSFFGIGALLSPRNFIVDNKFTPDSLLSSLSVGLIFWPVGVSLILGCSAWVALFLKGWLSQTEIEIIEEQPIPSEER
jgi:hypothetical protein